MKILALTPESAISLELGQRLARVRKQQGYTQIKLSEEAGIGVATLRRIEAGQDSQMETWIKILKPLNLIQSVDALLPEEIKSPMAEVRATTKKLGNSKSPPIRWDDEHS